MSEIKPQTMLYRPGTMITCGPHSLDYKIVDDEDVKATLAKGWYKTPDEAGEAEQKEREAAAQAALEAQAAAQQKLLDDANNSGNGSAKNPKTRTPKRTAKDQPGDLGADQTNADGSNSDNPDDNGEQE